MTRHSALYSGGMTLRGATVASLFAALAMLLAVSAGQHTAVLIATASAVALAAVLQRCTVSVLIAGTAQVAHAAAAARSSLRDTAFLPQRDPDAAGKPHPRAPGSNPVTG